MQTYSSFYSSQGECLPRKSFEHHQYRDYASWHWPNFQHALPYTTVPPLHENNGTAANIGHDRSHGSVDFHDMIELRGTGGIPQLLPPPAASHHRSHAAPGTKTSSPDEKDISEWDHIGNAGAAFLGPQLWEKTVPCDSELKFECMDLDEFLNENEIDDDLLKRNLSEGSSSGQGPFPSLDSPDDLSQLTPSLPSSTPQPFVSESPVSGSPSHDTNPRPDSVNSPCSSSDSPLTPESPFPADDKRFLAASSVHSRMGRGSPSRKSVAPGGHCLPSSTDYEGRRSRQKKGKCPLNAQISFSPTDFMLASVPGENFDPRTRSFSEDELKPQPMIKKSRKQYVPNELKDERYWARRRKNNMAAKRSRDARRTKENQIAMRANFLEKENQNLRMELDKTRTVLESIKKRLSVYESISG